MGNYVVVTSVEGKGISYALKSDFDSLIAPTWAEVTSGYASGYPKAIYSDGSVAFIGGTQGYIYYIEDPSDAPTTLDAGTLFVTTWNDAHGIGDEFVVMVGDQGAIAYTTNGVTFTALTTGPVGIGVNLNAVWVKSELEWWVGTSTGRLYYTLDGGATWTEKAFSGSGAGVVYDISFATNSVGYIAHASATPRGRILRTINGGYSWTITPEASGSTIPTNQRINAVAACVNDANFVVAGGLGLVTDGILLIGQ
jgi:photosystem II stability/assembly factor-like uncharacterized protein